MGSFILCPCGLFLLSCGILSSHTTRVIFLEWFPSLNTGQQKSVTDDCPASEAIECSLQFTFVIKFTAIIAINTLPKPPTLASPQAFCSILYFLGS